MRERERRTEGMSRGDREGRMMRGRGLKEKERREG